MTYTIPDQLARDQALDPQHSFIVQAPAGSGKTELLTQRFLVLLTLAQQAPEEIIALTFTRKAAAEMRGRILTALQQAKTYPQPALSHAQQTWQLARQVLQKDTELGWNLLANPHRLRILTIDSLCASLARQTPVLSGLGGSTTVSENPTPLYAQAARKLLASLETAAPWGQALEILLLHVDNDHLKAERLLVQMLAKRDQWLPYITENRDIRSLFEAALSNVIVENIEQLAQSISLHNTAELIVLIDFAAAHKSSTDSNGVVKDFVGLPPPHLKYLQQWQAIAALLVNKKGEWRKKYTYNDGFPAPASGKDKSAKIVFTQMKQRMQQFVQTCLPLENFRQALQTFLTSPPAKFSESQWDIIAALLELLPLLLAHLKIEFQLHDVVDYIEIANSALAALGEAENPTDLALILDYRIQHILIDEFQDTSANQYRLIEQLTAGWETGDGRSLFLVGDPMQSIYRFRKAEVGLFLRAKEIGIGAISLIPLTLSANFRSHQTIVNWVNNTFKSILPEVENIATGAVAYYPSIAIHTQAEMAGVQIYPFYNTDFSAEARQVTTIIQQTLALASQSTIAILVRAKTHLAAIFLALQAANITYNAVDIDPLFNRTVIQDLLALTQALLHFADHIAWLAVLRAPCCGLSLEDLYALVNAPGLTLWDKLQHYQDLALSREGSKRLARWVAILKPRLQQRRRLALAPWVESIWLALGGPACVTDPAELIDAQTFFSLLAKIATAGEIADLSQLTTALQKLYASPPREHRSQVDIMSIHKAKGLEFDTVILPGLGRELPSDDAQLLLWMERPKRHGGTDLIVAPMRAAHAQSDPIYDYLKQQEKIKNRHESGRLLYVAATRAKKHLHLLGHCSSVSASPAEIGAAPSKPATKSLLAHLWPTVTEIFQINQPLPVESTLIIAAPLKNERPLQRLSLNWQPFIVEETALPPIQTALANTKNELPLTYPQLQLHRLLRQQLPTIYRKRLSYQVHQAYWSAALQQQGILAADLDACLQQLQHIINTVLIDPYAAWLFADWQVSQTDYSITLSEQHKTSENSVDWTFIDQPTERWLVFYNFTHAPAAARTALMFEVSQAYQCYIHKTVTALQSIEQRTLRQGIYFAALGGWQELKTS